MKIVKTILLITILLSSFLLALPASAAKGPVGICYQLISHFVTKNKLPANRSYDQLILERVTQFIPQIQSKNPQYQNAFNLAYDEFQKTIKAMINEIPQEDRLEALLALRKAKFEPDLHAIGLCTRKTKCMQLNDIIQNEMASLIVFVHEFDHIIHYFIDKHEKLLTRELETQAFTRQYRFMKEILLIVEKEQHSLGVPSDEYLKSFLLNLDDLTRVELKKVMKRTEDEFVMDYLNHSTYKQRIYYEEVILKSLLWWRRRLPF